MDKTTTFLDAIQALKITDTNTADEIQSAGITPQSINSSSQFKSYVVYGITPEQFSATYAAAEFNYAELRILFGKYCKDFNNDLIENKASRALEFCSKILFEVGPNLRNEKKTKGDKLVWFNFCYSIEDEEDSTKHKRLRIKTVIVTTFRENTYVENEDGKMILTFKKAGMLTIAMDVGQLTSDGIVLNLITLCSYIVLYVTWWFI